MPRHSGASLDAALALSVAAASSATAQSLADRITAVGSGTVRPS